MSVRVVPFIRSACQSFDVGRCFVTRTKCASDGTLMMHRWFGDFRTCSETLSWEGFIAGNLYRAHSSRDGSWRKSGLLICQVGAFL